MNAEFLSRISSWRLSALDDHLLRPMERPQLAGRSQFFVEFLYFGIKEARACLFAGLFFAAIFIVPRDGLLGIARYDVLLIIAIAIQAWMVWTKLETVDELKAITLFHILGFALEVFKTSSGIQSWVYPDFAYTKLFGVPLFSGFMYAAVGSYIIQAWRLFALRVVHHPPYWMAGIIALLIYANFFTHHYIGDYRWYLWHWMATRSAISLPVVICSKRGTSVQTVTGCADLVLSRVGVHIERRRSCRASPESGDP
jgi:uncharacterized membrane protein YoaT (DUF817 family)